MRSALRRRVVDAVPDDTTYAGLELPQSKVSTVMVVTAEPSYEISNGVVDRETYYTTGIEVMRDEFGLNLSRGQVVSDEEVNRFGDRVKVEEFPSFKSDHVFRRITEYNPTSDEEYSHTWQSVRQMTSSVEESGTSIVSGTQQTRDFQLDRPRPRTSVDAMFEDFFGPR